jgi:HSP20 family protein
MFSLTTRNREDVFFPLDQVINDMFNSVFGDTELTSQVKNKVGFPKVNIYEEDGNYVVKASVAGLSKDDIEVEVQDGYLSLRGKTKDNKESKEKTYYVRELRESRFERIIKLPKDLKNLDQPTAKLDNGVLTLSWEVEKQKEKPKQLVEIK